MTLLTGTARVLADAAARGLEISLFERGPANSLEEAASQLGIVTGDIAKSLVVRFHSPEGEPNRYLFALVPGDGKISWRKLRAVVGVNKLSLPSPELAFEATGYERGTITPIGSRTDWPVFVDSALVGRRIAMGAGAHGFSAFVEADALITAFSATVADFTDPL